MSKSMVKFIDLDKLSDNVPIIDSDLAGWFKCHCMLALSKQGHSNGVELNVLFNEKNENFKILWTGTVTPKLQRSIGNDDNKLADFAACAIALPLIQEITEFQAFEQSALGTAFDYHLIRKDDNSDDDLFLNYSANLEISGILAENPNNTVQSRINTKQRRFEKTGTNGLPNFIVIVEFSQPWSHTVKA